MVYNAPTHAMQILKPAMKKITTIYPANPQYKKMILKHPESKLLSYSSPTQIQFRQVLSGSSGPLLQTLGLTLSSSSSGSGESFLKLPSGGKGLRVKMFYLLLHTAVLQSLPDQPSTHPFEHAPSDPHCAPSLQYPHLNSRGLLFVFYISLNLTKSDLQQFKTP